jgi:hypothetical protein
MHAPFLKFKKKTDFLLPFSAAGHLYGTGQFGQKNRFHTEPVRSGFEGRFGPVGSENWSDQPILLVPV